MSMANNDPNWRVKVGGVDLAANSPVSLVSGLAVLADPGAIATCAIGIVPQAVKAGDMAPVIRQGKLSEIDVVFTAGQTVYLAADGTLTPTPVGTPHFVQRLGYICADDVTTMYIDIQDPGSIVVGA
jgi:hypothetical protein